MKLLLDTCVSPRTRDALRAAGHEVTWVGDWNFDPGDEVILDTALNEGRVLVTIDKDFGELAVAFGRPHCGIVRLGDLRPTDQATTCADVLERHGEALSAGAIATVEPGRIRLRPGVDETGA